MNLNKSKYLNVKRIISQDNLCKLLVYNINVINLVLFISIFTVFSCKNGDSKVPLNESSRNASVFNESELESPIKHSGASNTGKLDTNKEYSNNYQTNPTCSKCNTGKLDTNKKCSNTQCPTNQTNPTCSKCNTGKLDTNKKCSNTQCPTNQTNPTCSKCNIGKLDTNKKCSNTQCSTNQTNPTCSKCNTGKLDTNKKCSNTQCPTNQTNPTCSKCNTGKLDINKKCSNTQCSTNQTNHSVTFGVYDSNAKKEIARIYNSVESTWTCHQSKFEELTLFETNRLIISYNNRWGVMSLGTPNLLMVDLDYKDKEVGNRKNAIAMLTKYAKENNITFAIRDSDRGLHAFVVSKRCDPKSDESAKIMWELFGDRRYIAYSKIRGFTARIGPKVFNTVKVGPGNNLLPYDKLKKEFISRRPKNDIIGDSTKIIPELTELLKLNDSLVKVMLDQFHKNYTDMTSGVPNGRKGLIPNSTLLNKILPLFKQKIKDFGYPLGGKYPYSKGKNIK